MPRWNDEGTHTHMMALGHLDTLICTLCWSLKEGWKRFVIPWFLEPLIWWNIWSWYPHHLVMESCVMGLKSIESILFKYYMIFLKKKLFPLDWWWWDPWYPWYDEYIMEPSSLLMWSLWMWRPLNPSFLLWCPLKSLTLELMHKVTWSMEPLCVKYLKSLTN